MALLNKVADGIGVLVSIARGEALIRHIKERKVTAVLDGIGDGAPLLRGWVHTSWVMGAGMEQEDAVLRGVLDVSEETVNVEANSLLVVVTVLLHIEPGVAEDSSMVSP